LKKWTFFTKGTDDAQDTTNIYERVQNGNRNGSVSDTDQSNGPINQETRRVSLIDVRFSSYDGSGSVPSITLTVCF
jgi:hypothetical protein